MTKTLKRLKRLGFSQSIYVRARKIDPYDRPSLPPSVIFPGQNATESRVTVALNELKIRNVPQYRFLGGDYLGGGRMDWFLPEYNIDLEFEGPHHSTSGGIARDALRNLGVSYTGVRVEKLYEIDLWRLKPRLLEIVGRRG